MSILINIMCGDFMNFSEDYKIINESNLFDSEYYCQCRQLNFWFHIFFLFLNWFVVHVEFSLFFVVSGYWWFFRVFVWDFVQDFISFFVYVLIISLVGFNTIMGRYFLSFRIKCAWFTLYVSFIPFCLLVLFISRLK